MGFVCKKCKLAFPEESVIINHLKMSDCSSGVVKLVQSEFVCKICIGNSAIVKFNSLNEWRSHFATSHVRDQPVTAPNLSDEMEDVVNQITALAAKAAAQSSPGIAGAADSNANIFCTQPGADAKSKLFITPNSFPVPSTGK